MWLKISIIGKFLCMGFVVIKMGKHRTRLEIVEDILSVINDNKNIRKTQIMYRAYLSHTLLIRYLSDVLDAGLIVCDNNSFYLTEKGKKFLARFGEYSRSRKKIMKQLSHVEDAHETLKEMCSNDGTGSTKSTSSRIE